VECRRLTCGLWIAGQTVLPYCLKCESTPGCNEGCHAGSRPGWAKPCALRTQPADSASSLAAHRTEAPYACLAELAHSPSWRTRRGVSASSASAGTPCCTQGIRCTGTAEAAVSCLSHWLQLSCNCTGCVPTGCTCLRSSKTDRRRQPIAGQQCKANQTSILPHSQTRGPRRAFQHGSPGLLRVPCLAAPGQARQCRTPPLACLSHTEAG